MIGGLRVRDQSRAGGDGSCSADGWLGGEGQIKIGLWALGRLLQGLDGRLIPPLFCLVLGLPGTSARGYYICTSLQSML